MSGVLHFSDTHFGTERPEVAQALVRLVHAQRPRLGVLSGDITQRATAAEFRAARAFVDRLALPALLPIPGNHDIPLFHLVARLFAPYARYRRAFGEELEAVFESDQLLVLAVRTTRRYRHEDGAVSARQVERVAARLAAGGARLRMVVTHQPVVVTKPSDRKNVLRGSERAVRAWTAAGADLILSGHIHLPFVVPLHRRFAGLGRPAWAVGAGTAVSSRLRHEAGNSVNLIRYDGLQGGARGVRVERWDYAEATQSFEAASSTELLLGEVGSAA